VPGIRVRARDGSIITWTAVGIHRRSRRAQRHRGRRSTCSMPRWYDPSGRETVPGGIITSRGCPGTLHVLRATT
jgi:hypothetical protein